MDDTPKAFIEEIRSSILKKRVGQIALAVVIAEAVWRLINAITWYLIIPVVGKFLEGNTESVLFESATKRPFPWTNLFASVLEFVFTVIVVFYLNRWINRKPRPMTDAQASQQEAPQNENKEVEIKEVDIGEPTFNSVGEPLTLDAAQDPDATH